MEDWTPNSISSRIVSILDSLAVSLRKQNLPNYFFPVVNLLLQPCVSDDDYKSDADILEMYLLQLSQDRSRFDLLNAEVSVQDHLETVSCKSYLMGVIESTCFFLNSSLTDI